MDPSTEKVLAFCASHQGRIREFIRDDAGVAPQVLGRLFPQMVHPASTPDALHFLAELDKEGHAYGWKLQLFTNEQMQQFTFAGLRQPGCLLILGASTDKALERLYEIMLPLHSGLLPDVKQRPQPSLQENRRENGRFLDDITQVNNELINLHRQLAQSNQELRRLNEQKNQFLGMAAHDLRNPLGIIMGYSEFLLKQKEGSLTKQQIQFIEIISSVSYHMRGLVDNFLSLSVIEVGKLQLDVQPTDLVSLIERNIQLNQVLANAKQTILHFTYPPDLPQALIDGQKVNQVLNNLIDNAVKYSPPQSHINVNAERAATAVQISVQNPGQGIPEKELNLLFQPFSRTSSLPTARESSTGLGLAISRRIIQAHGGEIWAESAINQGATFYFSLPMVDVFTYKNNCNELSKQRRVSHGTMPALPND